MLLKELFDEMMPSKSGVIPWYKDIDGNIKMMFAISSNGEYGGTDPMIAKGHIDDGETAIQAAIREGKEELGLKESNILSITRGWIGKITGNTNTYIMEIFIAEIINEDDFDQFHYETAETVWLTFEEFQQKGRKTQVEIVQKSFLKMK